MAPGSIVLAAAISASVTLIFIGRVNIDAGGFGRDSSVAFIKFHRGLVSKLTISAAKRNREHEISVNFRSASFAPR